MNLFDVMTQGLLRGDTNDFAVVAGRAPCVKVGRDYVPITDQVPSEGDVLEMLAALGGSSYIDKLGTEPSVWRANEDSLGPLQVTAARRQGVLQARVVRQPFGTQAAAPSAAIPVAPAAQVAPAVSATYAAPPRRATYAAPAAPVTYAAPAAPVAKRAVLAHETPPATPVAKRSSSPPRRIDVGSNVSYDPRLESLLSQARAMGASNLHIVATCPLSIAWPEISYPLARPWSRATWRACSSVQCRRVS